jgi:hypothetical protein
VAPDVSNETPEGGAFTQAVIKVLSKQKLDSMTVQSFSGHIQAAMYMLAPRLSLVYTDEFVGTTSKFVV